VQFDAYIHSGCSHGNSGRRSKIWVVVNFRLSRALSAAEALTSSFEMEFQSDMAARLERGAM